MFRKIIIVALAVFASIAPIAAQVPSPTDASKIRMQEGNNYFISTIADVFKARQLVDTVQNFEALRSYNAGAPLVFVKANGIQGLFQRVTGSWTDDGGITIVGTNKFRRVAEDLRRVNVRWFGAVGDSTTNDNTAIQAALAFVKDTMNATLYFPAGKYRYTATLVLYKPNNVAIQGDGMHNTYLFPVNVTGIYVRTDSSTTIYYGDYGVKEARDFQIRDLSLMRVGSNTFSSKIYGLDLRGGFNKKLENVSVRNYFASSGTGVGSVGIRLWQPTNSADATQHTIFDNVFVSRCDTGIVSRLQNTMQWRGVKVDACKKVGVALSNSLFWDGGLCQGNENCGLYLKNSDPYVLSEVTIQGVHFEANAYVAPKWGGIYKPDNTDMNDLNIHDCYLSSPGNSHMLRLKRVQHSAIVNNKYSGSGITDTISLTSFYDCQFGNDDYTRLKLVTSDCYITWLGGSTSTSASEVGYNIGMAAPGANYLGVGGGVAIGSTYAASNTAPTDGAIIKGNVAIGNTTADRTLDVAGEARITDLTTDPPTRIVGADGDGDLGELSLSSELGIASGTLKIAQQSATSGQVLEWNGSAWVPGTDDTISGSGQDSTWAKTAGGYANKRIADPIYRSSSARINMTGDSAALTLKYASTQTNPVLKIQYNNGTTAAIAHVYNSTNPSLVFGGTPSVNSSSANNTIFGLTAPTFTSGAGQNSFFGKSAGNACNGCYENTFLGSSAGASTTDGFQNTFIGYLAGNTNTTGYQNMFLGRRAGTTNLSGAGNIAIGSDALRLNSSGSSNIAIGIQAGDGVLGSKNTMLGAAAGRLTTGSGNLFIGASAGELLTSVSNYLVIDNSNTSTPLLAGDFASNKFGINTAPGSLVRDLNVTGEARITDLTTDTPTGIVGADGDGDLGTVSLSSELGIASGTLKLAQQGATSGQVLEWNGSAWAPATDDTGGGGSSYYQTMRDDGTDKTQRAALNFVNSTTVTSTLTDDSGNGETEVSMSVPTDGITATEIAANAVGSSEIAADAVGQSEIASGAVGQDEIATDGVGELEIEAASVGTSEVANNSLLAADLAVNVVSSVDGVTNDGGDVDFVAGANMKITPSDGSDNVTFDALAGSISPSQITSDQDDYNPTNWSTNTTARISGDATIRAITSFAALSDGTVRRLVNIGTTAIYIPAEHPDGTAANRVAGSCDQVLAPNGGMIEMYYDGTSSRWRVIHNTFNPANMMETGLTGHYYNVSGGSTVAADWGDLGLATASGGNGQTAPTSALPAGWDINTASSASGVATLYFADGVTNPTEIGSSHIITSCMVYFPTLSDGTQTYTFQFGLIPTPTSTTLNVNNSIGIRYTNGTNSGKWQGFSRDNAGAESTADLGTTVAANTNYVLTVCLDKARSEARFYLNGAYAGRVTANMPNAGDVGGRVGIFKSAGTTSRTASVASYIFYTVY